jgi:hypothetical protein
MIYIIWHDYDDTYIECFNDPREWANRKAAEKKLTEIVKKEEAEENGTQLLKIIDGKEVSYRVAKRIDSAEIVPLIALKPRTT